MNKLPFGLKWEDAPSWAQFIIRNDSGVWYYTKYEPFNSGEGYWITTGLQEVLGCEPVKEKPYTLIKLSRGIVNAE